MGESGFSEFLIADKVKVLDNRLSLSFLEEDITIKWNSFEIESFDADGGLTFISKNFDPTVNPSGSDNELSNSITTDELKLTVTVKPNLSNSGVDFEIKIEEEEEIPFSSFKITFFADVVAPPDVLSNALVNDNSYFVNNLAFKYTKQTSNGLTVGNVEPLAANEGILQFDSGQFFNSIGSGLVFEGNISTIRRDFYSENVNALGNRLNISYPEENVTLLWKSVTKGSNTVSISNGVVEEAEEDNTILLSSKFDSTDFLFLTQSQDFANTGKKFESDLSGLGIDLNVPLDSEASDQLAYIFNFGDVNSEEEVRFTAEIQTSDDITLIEEETRYVIQAGRVNIITENIFYYAYPTIEGEEQIYAIYPVNVSINNETKLVTWTFKPGEPGELEEPPSEGSKFQIIFCGTIGTRLEIIEEKEDVFPIWAIVLICLAALLLFLAILWAVRKRKRT